MVITHIIADNLLKYTHLELTDISRQGLITISGQNESGKSTIGETVCFALFGRTFSIDEDEITRVIRWGESRCSVRLGFAIGDKDYEIARFLDNEGNHGARLYPAGEEEHPFAKGVNAVSEALDELLGYQFEEFVESFYLAQREITTPHPHSHAIKTMAGISALEKVADELSADLKNEQRKLPDIEEQINMLEGDIRALKIEPGKLKGLELEVETIQQFGDTLQKNDEELAKASQDYRDGLSSFKSARTTRRFTGLLAVIALFAALASGISWYLLNYMPGSTYTQKLTEVLNNTPSLEEYYTSHLGMDFAISIAVFLFFWLISFRMKRKSTGLEKNGTALADQLLVVSELLKLPEEEKISTSDLSLIRKYNLSKDRCTAVVELTQQQLNDAMAEQQNSQQMFEDLLSIEQDRLAKADALMGVIDNLNEKTDKVKHRIQIRTIADELTSAAARHFSQRFNKDLRELASRTLPLFTEERYEHLHIGDDLSVRAFSSLKRDYMDLDEISSGTQRQIMLAVRLALSQELVNTTGGGDQFIFLDEPFAFFDQTRTRNAMAILPKLSEEIRQIWVIAQEFPEDTHYDRAIVCSREYDSLSPEAS
ncbi:MAG: AAA family ATPase [Pseudomonadota bacterium]|nr:AAA family ATPase [Pseudomonadota bacterium]